MLEGDDVRDVPLEERVYTVLRDIARPVDLMVVVAPDDQLSVVIDKAYETDRRFFFVVEEEPGAGYGGRGGRGEHAESQETLAGRQSRRWRPLSFLRGRPPR